VVYMVAPWVTYLSRVVADSDPTAEWKETEAKARAVLTAADLVQGGLDAPHD
jgi:anthranilate synthase component I